MCSVCGEVIVAGEDLCIECSGCVEELADYCRPDECRHGDDEEGMA